MRALPTLGRMILGILAGLVVAGSARAQVETKEDVVKGTDQELVRMADNAIFLLDSSSSMTDTYKDTGLTTWNLVRQFMAARNANFPDLGMKVGIYRYTPWKEVYPLGAYDREKVAAALQSLPAEAEGPTLLQSGLKELEGILKKASGKTAVFIFSDGTYSTATTLQKPVEIAENLVDKYDVCFTVISTAKEEVNEELLKRMGSLNSCSRVVSFSNFIQNPTYTTGALYDFKATASAKKEQVPGLKAGDLTFRFDGTELRHEDQLELNEVISFINTTPGSWVRVAGYTDNTGNEAANLSSSRSQVEAVEKMLLAGGIEQSRIMTQWYGEANPIASNDTEEGRALNRRVEIAVGMKGAPISSGTAGRSE